MVPTCLPCLSNQTSQNNQTKDKSYGGYRRDTRVHVLDMLSQLICACIYKQRPSVTNVLNTLHC